MTVVMHAPKIKKAKTSKLIPAAQAFYVAPLHGSARNISNPEAINQSTQSQG